MIKKLDTCNRATFIGFEKPTTGINKHSTLISDLEAWKCTLGLSLMSSTDVNIVQQYAPNAELLIYLYKQGGVQGKLRKNPNSLHLTKVLKISSVTARL